MDSSPPEKEKGRNANSGPIICPEEVTRINTAVLKRNDSVPPASAQELVQRYTQYKNNRDYPPPRAGDDPNSPKHLEGLYGILGRAVLIPCKIWGRPDENGNFDSKGGPIFNGWPTITF